MVKLIIYAVVAWFLLDKVAPNLMVSAEQAQRASQAQSDAIAVGVTIPSVQTDLTAPTPAPYNGGVAVLVPGYDPSLSVISEQ